MKRKSIILFGIGFLLLAIGTYNIFEAYDDYLEKENSYNEYDGSYFSEDNEIIVSSIGKDLIKVLINNESFEFESDGNYYKNEAIDCLIKFENDSLLIIKNGEMENELYLKSK